MKRFSPILIIFALGSCLAWTQAYGPDHEFFQIYSLIQQADRLEETQGTQAAQERYQEALDALLAFTKRYPSWNREIVGFRIRYLQDKTGPSDGESKTQSESIAKALDTPEVTNLKERIRELEQTNTGLNQRIRVLEAKLNEALSANPTNVDPEEMRRARDQIRMLEEEKGLLQATIDEMRSTDRNPNAPAVVNPSVVRDLERAQRELALANQKASEQAATIARLLEAQENQTLQPGSSGIVASSPPPPANVIQLQTELRSLKEENESLRKSLNDISNSADGSTLTARIRELQSELNTTKEALYNNEMHIKLAEIEKMTNQIAILRTKLDAYEAKKEPYTEEELALIKESKPELQETPIDSTNRSRNALNQLPSGSAAFAEAARRAYASGRLEAAEENFRRILALDENNIYTLNNLAIVLVEQNKTAEAQEILDKTLDIAPNDPKSLGIMGILKYRTQDYDASFDYLSRAVKVDPDNSETQNYLGILLNQKGQRDAAEAALRKAVKINPNYANAHFNLAIAYATQEPPFLELARWHYNKAVALGHEKDARVEAYFSKL